MFENIPKNRLLLYIAALGLLPIFFAVSHFFSEQSSFESLEETILNMQNQAIVKEQRQSINKAMMYHFRDSDHTYVDKYLETLRFLEPEVESLQKITSNPNFAGDDTVLKRLNLLTGTGNQLQFSEGNVIVYPQFQESTLTLIHPVEVNAFDIQQILALVEGQNIGIFSSKPNRPQLIILDFSLDKKNTSGKSEVYDLNIRILKREYL